MGVLQLLSCMCLGAVVSGRRKSLLKADLEAGEPTLELRYTTQYEESYSDQGTGSKQDIHVFRPKLFSGEYRLFYTALPRDENDARTVVVKSYANKALVQPTQFVCEWTDAGSGGKKDGSIWRPVAPSGYTCLSDVAVYMSNKGNKPGKTRSANDIDSNFRCVHNSLVIQTGLGDRIWTDRGSGGKFDGAVWAIEGSDGMKGGKGKKDEPPYTQYRLKAFTGALYRDLVLVTAINNPHRVEQPAASYKMIRGLSSTRSSSTELSAEMGVEVTKTATAGVEGVASSSLSVTVWAKFGVSTKFSAADTNTKASEVTVKFAVPPKTRVELYQLIAKDAKTGPGEFTVKSGQYTILYKDL